MATTPKRKKTAWTLREDLANIIAADAAATGRRPSWYLDNAIEAYLVNQGLMKKPASAQPMKKENKSTEQ